MEDGRTGNVASFLHGLPALAVLELLPLATLGIGRFGEIVYANPACATLLGYVDGRTVTRLYLPDLLTGCEGLEPSECEQRLRAPATVVQWNHSQEYVIHTILSAPLLLRADDRLLLIGMTDVTDWLWENNRGSEREVG